MPAERQNENPNEQAELVRKVTERVYALLLADLKRQGERSRRSDKTWRVKR